MTDSLTQTTLSNGLKVLLKEYPKSKYAGPAKDMIKRLSVKTTK